MKSSKEKQAKAPERRKRPMSPAKRIGLGILCAAAVIAVLYLAYYFFHYMNYNEYQKSLSSYEYETGGTYAPLQEARADVPGYELVSETESLKLYTDPATANVAVYDKRNGQITYSNPPDADNDSIANATNLALLKSQFVLYYYDADVKSGNYNSYAGSVAKNQFYPEGIEGGIRYVYQVGDQDDASIHFDVPLEYRLKDDYLEVSVPVKGIHEYGNGYVYRIQLLRFFGATSYEDEGYLVVPNGSGSLIRFNNGKTAAANYSQYVYDIDPLAANYTTLENTETARLGLFGICKEDSGLLVTIEDGASTSLITAGVSGAYNDYNYAYPTFVLRIADNLRMFGDSTQDVYVMEPDAYDVNLTVRYTFLTEEYGGYDGLANYYRERLVREGVLDTKQEGGNIPFYYDVIAGVKETAHFLGTQYLSTFSMTDFDEAREISNELVASGIDNQVMNLQGWFNGGYYHDAPDKVKVIRKLGGKSDLESLNDAVAANGGRMYADVAFQQVTEADDGFNYGSEGARYYGAGYVASFGLVNPTTLRNTSSLGYIENGYDVLSPKFLPRYVGKFIKKVNGLGISGISLRDLGSYLSSDKKRTNLINREEALDVVLAQLQALEGTGKAILTNQANDYAFAYSDGIINAPVAGNTYAIIDEDIPLYEMILHGYIPCGSELLNFENRDDAGRIALELIEAGVSPHYVFTWKASNEMKETALNRYYSTTFSTWKAEAVSTYNKVNEALSQVSGAAMTGHEILDNGVRKVTYENGVVIYINYGEEEQQADGFTIPALSYRLEGK